ncbi:MAG: rRNA maturation RNase YbeY [Candidatus Omnitrophica bacterium]|nr:rRNA maturation RNase YbeY [Candidatus Omnitrophota bacterium]
MNVQKILNQQKIVKASLNFVFVSGRKMRFLNSRYMNHHDTTDVLTFDLKDKPDDQRVRGEIFISADEAVKNARIYKTSPDQELKLYIIHGILHLLGYDDHRPSDIKKMREKEQQLLGI